MSQKQTKRKRTKAEKPVRRTIAKHRKVIVESDDNVDDTAMSDVSTGDLLPVT